MNIKSTLKAILPDSVISFKRDCETYAPKEIKKDLIANKAIRRVRNRPHLNSRIKVAFIAQMAEIWDKEAPIYDAMLLDSAFEPSVIVIPPYNQKTKSVEMAYDESNYFISRYPSCVRACEGREWISMESMNFDYVFLPRPYDHYLPEGFRSYHLAQFAKVCYVPYGFSGADVFNAGNSNKAFFRNVYFSFLESEYMLNILSRKFKTRAEKRNHKLLNLGYPALIPYFSFPQISAVRTIMWTPRWSFDSVIGGSNFLNYKDCFMEAVRAHPEFKFVFRPHPLMFGEILDKGYMSQEEISDYLRHLTSLGVVYDKNTPVVESLRNADVLITDFSSIIIQFFLTGRPIIYCESCIQMNQTYQKLKSGMYIVNSKDDFLNEINGLSITGDYLKPKRQEIICDGFDYHKNATNNILNAIKQDYNEA